MLSLDHLFPEQRSDEKILLVTRRHWIVFTIDVLTSVVVLAIYAALYWGFVFVFPEIANEFSRVLLLISIIVVMSVMLRTYMSWIDYYLDVFIVTDNRVVEIIQHTLFNRQISEMQLEHIEDVSSKSVGILGTFMGYGTIFMQTAGATDVFEFLRMPKPNEVTKLVLDAQHRDEMRRTPPVAH